MGISGLVQPQVFQELFDNLGLLNALVRHLDDHFHLAATLLDRCAFGSMEKNRLSHCAQVIEQLTHRVQ